MPVDLTARETYWMTRALYAGYDPGFMAASNCPTLRRLARRGLVEMNPFHVSRTAAWRITAKGQAQYHLV